MPKIPVLPTLAVSQSAAERIGLKAVIEVVAVFTRGLVVFPQGRIGEWPIFLSAADQGLLPEHIVVRGIDISRLLNSAQVGDEMRVCVRKVFDPVLLPKERERRSVSRGFQALEVWLSETVGSDGQTGLGIPISDVLSDNWEFAAVFASAFHKTTDGKLPAMSTRRLIGRGGGSTPTGDDMLTGAGAVMTGWKLTFTPWLLGDLRQLAPQFTQLTTATSAAYLHWAVRGRYSSDLIRVVRAVLTGDEERLPFFASRLLRHGATSGLDALLGIFLTVQAGLRAEIR